MTDRDADFVPALAYHWLTPLYDRVVAATTREQEVKRALIVQAAIRPEHVVLDLWRLAQAHWRCGSSNPRQASP